VGSLLCLSLLCASCFVYSSTFHRISISDALKHCLVNVWLSMCWLVFFFTAGVHQVGRSSYEPYSNNFSQVEHVLTCQVVGMALHYFTVAALVWLLLGVNAVLKAAASRRQLLNAVQVRQQRHTLLGGGRHENPKDGGKVAGMEEPPPLRLYMIGWGATALLTSVVAASDPAHFGVVTSAAVGRSYCFMPMTPFLAGLILPASLLTALLVGLAFSAWCVAGAPELATQFIDDVVSRSD